MLIGLGYFIKYRQAYWLIQDYRSASEEEKKEMEAKGVGSFIANWMFGLGGWMLLGTIFIVIKVPYATGLTYGGLLIGIIIMMVMNLKYTPKRKRRLNLALTVGTAVFILVMVSYVIYSTVSTNSLVIEDQTLEVTGEYGREWELADIEAYYLTDEWPNIRRRTNGMSTESRKKGQFIIEEWGKGWLYLYTDRPPYIVIKSKDHFMMINAEDPNVTQQWFNELTEAMETR